MERLKAWLQDTNKQRFLDIGTGTGEFLKLLAHLYDGYDSMVGIDRLERFVAIASERNDNPRISYEHMDGNDMSYEDDSFDVVTLSNSLHHLENIQVTLSEMARVTKKDGFIMINEMIRDNLSPAQVSHKLMHHFAAKIDRLNKEFHDETFSKETILSTLTKDTDLVVEEAWELAVPTNQTTQEQLDFLDSLLDKLVARAPEEFQSDLQEEASEIQAYIHANGYDGCTSLLVVLRKTA